MGENERGGFDVNLGDLIAISGGLAVYCAPYPVGCGRTLDVDVYDLAWLFGSRMRHVNARLPLKFGRCGCRRLEWRTVSDERPDWARKGMPPRNFRPSRSEEERRALMLLYPRRE